MKQRFKLRLVLPAERPLGTLSRAEKLAHAKAYLQRRGIYVLDKGTPKPRWGVGGEIPKELNEAFARRTAESDRRRDDSKRTFFGRIGMALRTIVQ